MNDGDFSVEDLNYTVKRTFNNLIRNKSSSASPVAFVLGGQPGAGKTGLQRMMKAQCNDNLILINGDEFRELHPDFTRLQEKYGKDSVEYTGKFSGQVTEALVSKLKEQKYNVLVEGTLRTAEVPLNTCKGFKESGYNVTLALMAVKPEISYLSTILRYEQMNAAGKQPRATSKDKHDHVVERIPDNLKEIYGSKQFDNIVIYNREGKCLYDMSKEPNISPSTVMQEMFTGKWSQHELDQFISIGNAAQKFMEQRNAPELPDFKRNIFNKGIIAGIAHKNGLRFNDYFIKEVSEAELSKLASSGLRFSVCRKNGKIAVKFNAEHKEKVDQILGNKPVIKNKNVL